MITDVCFFDGYEESTGKSNELKIYSLIEKGKGCLCFFIGDDTKESLKKYAFNTPYEKEIIVETNGEKIIIPSSFYIEKNMNNEYDFMFSFKENEMPKTDSGVLILCVFGVKERSNFIKNTYPTNGRRDRNIIIYLDDNTKLDYTINIIY